MANQYSELCTIDSFNQGVGQKNFEGASLALKINTEIESEEIDRRLWQHCQDNEYLSDALLCLRCRASHPIVGKVKQIFNQNRNKYELDLLEILACVLDDCGENFLRIPKNNDDKSLDFIRKPFCWNSLALFPGKKIRPFGAEVIYSFDPSLSNLSTWAKNKVQSNAELKSCLRNSGLLLISKWALIADSSPTRVSQAWKWCGSGSMQLEEVEKLHASYLVEYKIAKQIYKKRTGRNSGWEPDKKFLVSLTPTQTDLKNLVLIDDAIRKYLSGANYGVEEFKDDIPQASSDQNSEFSEELINQILQSLTSTAFKTVSHEINSDRSRWEKDPNRKLAWQLYSEGLGQRDIAFRCDHKQAWVSKLLKEKMLAEIIAQESAEELIKRTDFISIRVDPVGLDRMIEQLTIYLTTSKQESGVSLLRQSVATALKQ